MKPLFVHRALFVVSVFSAGILLFACNKSDNNMNNNSPVSGFMAVNLATDKAVNVSLSGALITNGPLAFTSYTGDYLSVNSASRPVQTIDFNTSAVLDSSTFNFAPTRFYSLFVTGTNGHYRNVIVNDNFDSLPTGKAYVRYVNAIPDSSAPTVTITANGDNVVNNTAPFNTVSNF
ncbi:MAG TPA: DUF4397 domain-containing protein, partial [Chitinophagaceae bacterium]|nr:DUF4397 domain-containing protein [Chitinophagaceae bacterium]